MSLYLYCKFLLIFNKPENLMNQSFSVVSAPFINWCCLIGSGEGSRIACLSRGHVQACANPRHIEFVLSLINSVQSKGNQTNHHFDAATMAPPVQRQNSWLRSPKFPSRNNVVPKKIRHVHWNGRVALLEDGRVGLNGDMRFRLSLGKANFDCSK